MHTAYDHNDVQFIAAKAATGNSSTSNPPSHQCQLSPGTMAFSNMQPHVAFGMEDIARNKIAKQLCRASTKHTDLELCLYLMIENAGNVTRTHALMPGRVSSAVVASVCRMVWQRSLAVASSVQKSGMLPLCKSLLG